jgi:hypothetical protein
MHVGSYSSSMNITLCTNDAQLRKGWMVFVCVQGSALLPAVLRWLLQGCAAQCAQQQQRCGRSAPRSHYVSRRGQQG